MHLQITLLTHEREVDRPTNTGCIALAQLPHICRRIVWSRVEPDDSLLSLAAQSNTWLLFPASERQPDPELHYSQPSFFAQHASVNIIILDATWQEANKMFRQSPYLKQLKRLSFSDIAPSNYVLRRNQVAGGLCTLECVAQLMADAGCQQDAQQLHQALTEMPTSRQPKGLDHR